MALSALATLSCQRRCRPLTAAAAVKVRLHSARKRLKIAVHAEDEHLRVLPRGAVGPWDSGGSDQLHDEVRLPQRGVSLSTGACGLHIRVQSGQLALSQPLKPLFRRVPPFLASRLWSPRTSASPCHRPTTDRIRFRLYNATTLLKAHQPLHFSPGGSLQTLSERFRCTQ